MRINYVILEKLINEEFLMGPVFGLTKNKRIRRTECVRYMGKRR
jgi:hypothetical protein